MSRLKIGSLIVVLLLAALLPRPASPVAAQVGANCPAVVQTALNSIDDVCTGLGRNETCYGYNRVDALFWATDESLVFDAPSDRVPLIEVQRLATAPLDIDQNEWGIAAMQIQSPNLPATLPGQAVMFLLMGDVSLDSQVAPEDVATPVTPVEATTNEEITLYSFPTLEANRVSTIPEGTRVQAVGQVSAGDWIEILYNQRGSAWVETAALDVEETDAFAALPVTYGDDAPPRYGPMQAFYFETGLAGPSCNEAPDALVVQSPGGARVALEINDLQVEIGSTVAFTTVTTGDNPEMRVLVGILFEGHLRIFINGQWIELSEPGQSFAITLNEDGLVDENSILMQLGNDPLTEWLHSACSVASEVDLLDSTSFAAACDTEVTYFTTDEGFVSALGFPSNLPTLGETTPPQNPPANNPPPPPPPPAPPVQVPLQWPQITSPASGTTLVGGGSHTVNWTATPGATGYRLDVYPDTTNQVASSLSFQTGGTSYQLPLDSLPSRPAPGWGYFMRVVPLDGGGPMGPADQAPAIWIVRQDPAQQEPPPQVTEEAPPAPTEEVTEEPRDVPTEEVTEEPRDPTGGEPYCYEVCDEIEGCYTICEGQDAIQQSLLAQ